MDDEDDISEQMNGDIELDAMLAAAAADEENQTDSSNQAI
jgi:hypothetical protein